MAVALHGYPRLTRDIDLLIRTIDVVGAGDALATIGFTVLGGIPIYVVSRDGLITMKRIVGRLQDLSDIANPEGANDNDKKI
ncbi:hypothetical protein ES705_13412 [subsurface metagenome]